MTDERIKEIQDKIKFADKTRDLIKIEKDIDEGLELLKTDNEHQKREYVNKINKDYLEYVTAMQIGFSIRRSLLGNSATRSLISYDEEITQDIRMLQIIFSGKLYEEIKKVINGEKNKFEGGVIDEKEF